MQHPNSNDVIFDLSPVKQMLTQTASLRGGLIPVLQQIQEYYGYLPENALEAVAGALGVPLTEVYGVATFYKQFRLKPAGRFVIMVCDGTACHVNGSSDILQTLSEELGIGDGETTEDRFFTIQSVACLGCCSLSPAMMINGETYGNLTKEKVLSIIAAIRENAS